MIKQHLRIIGDVHGIDWRKGAHARTYRTLVQGANHSVQVGDLGFSETWTRVSERVDGSVHKVLGGNHDDYDWIEKHQPECYLGNHGTHKFPGFEFFYIRGGNSIDRQYRTAGWDWWPQEELNMEECTEALCAYIEAKPEIVITHDIPFSMYSAFITNDWKTERCSNTAHLLEECIQKHQPKLWIFGHHHNNSIQLHGDTTYICLNELCYLDFNKEGKMVNVGIK